VSAWRSNGVLVVGHRGGRGEGWPAENTFDAFERARAQGARAIELDARTTARGEVVVFHDRTLERMTEGGDIRGVSEVSFAALRNVDIGGARVPRLDEVLGWARLHGVAVNVELKHDVHSRVGLARETVRVTREAGADVLYSSFDPVLLALVAALDPGKPRALLVHSGQPLWARALQGGARPPLFSALHLERSQTGRRVLRRYLDRGLRIGVWTVNDPGEAADLARHGVESIITDRPGDVLAALRA
jgi:glycerophosphoryl diester phosphodiesterase